VLLLLPVGGGTSGAVLASRLAEEKKKSVLVIEAGRDPSGVLSIDIPLLADSVRGTEFDWQYRTVPQKSACLGHVDRVRIPTILLAYFAMKREHIIRINISEGQTTDLYNTI